MSLMVDPLIRHVSLVKKFGSQRKNDLSQRKKSLQCLQGVNFISILQSAFYTLVFCTAFFVVKECVCNFSVEGN